MLRARAGGAFTYRDVIFADFHVFGDLWAIDALNKGSWRKRVGPVALNLAWSLLSPGRPEGRLRCEVKIPANSELVELNGARREG